MPLQNRVDPFGELLAVPERGAWLGNRGILHGADRRLTGRGWDTPRWIACVTDFRGRRAEVWAPRHYTQLFFLDEATALAAGHRPCAQCRWSDFRRFVDAWRRGTGWTGPDRPIADAIDRQLHAERIRPDARRVLSRVRRIRYPARVGDLPEGVFVTDEADSPAARLYARGCLHTWTPGGYRDARPVPAERAVWVLTPRSIVAAIAAGYRPSLHESVHGDPGAAG